MSWPEVAFETLASSEVYSFIGGPFGSKLTSRDYIDEGVPVIRGSNMGRGRYLDFEDFVYVSESKVREDLASNLAFPGDMIFTQRGTLGQVAIIPDDSPFELFVVSQSQMKVAVDETKADKRFLYYYFSSPLGVSRILNQTSSSGVPHINLSILRTFKIPCPDIARQKAIADILSAYDDLIENNRRRMALLEESARLLYREWFVNLRFPGHEHVPVKDGVPEGWERKKIGEASAFLSRGITPKYDDDAPGLVINQKCIRNNRVTLDLARRQSKEVPLARLIRRGDVLINSTGEGTLGRVAQLWVEIENCTVDSHVTIVRPAEGIPLGLFGAALCSMEETISQMGRGSTNQTELSKESVAELLIFLPPNGLAQEFEETNSALSSQISNLSNQNRQLSSARDLLLPRLMNGEIAV